jgi:lipid-A-disaccharide synthase-like uncharacterized protein
MSPLTGHLGILLDPWIIFGFAAQAIFFSRFVVQWLASERAGRTVVPRSFWYLSLLGAVMILLYAIRQGDIVFIAGQAAALLIYVRNLSIASRPTPLEVSRSVANSTV